MFRIICGLAAAAFLFSTGCTKKNAQTAAPGADGPEARAARTCDVATLRELKTNFAFVSYAYCIVLARPADESGRAYWMKSLAVRNDRLAVFTSFAAVPEFSLGMFNGVTAKSLPEDQYIVYAFKRVLNRAPTPEEVKDWKGKWAKGKWSKAIVAQEVMKTREARELHHL